MFNLYSLYKTIIYTTPVIFLVGCSAGLEVKSQASNVYGVEVLYDLGWSGDRKEFFYQEAKKLCLRKHGTEKYRVTGTPRIHSYTSLQSEINQDTRDIHAVIECEIPKSQEVAIAPKNKQNQIFLDTGGDRLAFNAAKTYLLEVNGKPATEFPTFSCVWGANPPCRETPKTKHNEDVSTAIILSPGQYQIVIGRATIYTGPGMSHVLDKDAFKATLHVTFDENDVGRRFVANTFWSEGRYWSSISRMKSCSEGYPLIEVIAGEAPPDFVKLFGLEHMKCHPK